MRRRWGSMNKKKLLSGPYFVWMILFTIIPLLVIAWYGFTDRTGAFTLANVKAIASPEHLKAGDYHLVYQLPVRFFVC